MSYPPEITPEALLLAIDDGLLTRALSEALRPLAQKEGTWSLGSERAGFSSEWKAYWKCHPKSVTIAMSACILYAEKYPQSRVSRRTQLAVEAGMICSALGRVVRDLGSSPQDDQLTIAASYCKEALINLDVLRSSLGLPPRGSAESGVRASAGNLAGARGPSAGRDRTSAGGLAGARGPAAGRALSGKVCDRHETEREGARLVIAMLGASDLALPEISYRRVALLRSLSSYITKSASVTHGAVTKALERGFQLEGADGEYVKLNKDDVRKAVARLETWLTESAPCGPAEWTGTEGILDCLPAISHQLPVMDLLSLREVSKACSQACASALALVASRQAAHLTLSKALLHNGEPRAVLEHYIVWHREIYGTRGSALWRFFARLSESKVRGVIANILDEVLSDMGVRMSFTRSDELKSDLTRFAERAIEAAEARAAGPAPPDALTGAAEAV